MQPLREYLDSVGMIKATYILGKPEGTIRSRLRSGKNWQILIVKDKKRCVLIDDSETRS